MPSLPFIRFINIRILNMSFEIRDVQNRVIKMKFERENNHPFFIYHFYFHALFLSLMHHFYFS